MSVGAMVHLDDAEYLRCPYPALAASVLPGWHLPVHAVSVGPVERFRAANEAP